MYLMFPRCDHVNINHSCIVHVTSVTLMCQFDPLHDRVKVISYMYLHYESVESIDIDQPAHLRMLINAFAIPSSIKI